MVGQLDYVCCLGTLQLPYSIWQNLDFFEVLEGPSLSWDNLYHSSKYEGTDLYQNQQ